MNENPLLGKMDALLKKHRGGSAGDQPLAPELAAPTERTTASGSTPPLNAWLPVLTQLIERGTPPVSVAPTHSPVAEPAPPAEALAADGAISQSPPAETPAPVSSDTLAEQLMSELAPRLSEVMEKQLAAELRKNIDQTVANLLSQLDVNVREIVRDAVAEKLKQPRDPAS